MEYVNKIILAGRVGQITSDQFFTRFSLVTESTYSSNDGAFIIEDVWFSIVVDKNKVEGVLEKNCWAEVEGRVRMRKYIDSEGIERITWNVLAQKCRAKTTI